MELKEYLVLYRRAHDLSQRRFAEQCGLSNGYISMLERGFNPKTGQPITPTLPKLKMIANGMGLELTDLLSQVDDMLIDLQQEETLNCTQTNIIRIAGRDGSYTEKRLTDDQVKALRIILDQMPEAEDL